MAEIKMSTAMAEMYGVEFLTRLNCFWCKYEFEDSVKAHVYMAIPCPSCRQTFQISAGPDEPLVIDEEMPDEIPF